MENTFTRKLNLPVVHRWLASAWNDKVWLPKTKLTYTYSRLSWRDMCNILFIPIMVQFNSSAIVFYSYVKATLIRIIFSRHATWVTVMNTCSWNHVLLMKMLPKICTLSRVNFCASFELALRWRAHTSNLPYYLFYEAFVNRVTLEDGNGPNIISSEFFSPSKMAIG